MAASEPLLPRAIERRGRDNLLVVGVISGTRSRLDRNQLSLTPLARRTGRAARNPRCCIVDLFEAVGEGSS